MKFATNVAKYVLLFPLPLRHMEQQNNLKIVVKNAKNTKKKKNLKQRKTC